LPALLRAGNGLLGPQRRRRLWNVTFGQPGKLAEEQRKSLYLVSMIQKLLFEACLRSGSFLSITIILLGFDKGSPENEKGK